MMDHFYCQDTAWHIKEEIVRDLFGGECKEDTADTIESVSYSLLRLGVDSGALKNYIESIISAVKDEYGD